MQRKGHSQRLEARAAYDAPGGISSCGKNDTDHRGVADVAGIVRAISLAEPRTVVTRLGSWLPQPLAQGNTATGRRSGIPLAGLGSSTFRAA